MGINMAHFAKLDENNVVLEILKIDNNDINNLSFPESEQIGIDFLNSFLPSAIWKQTSYNNNFRFRYAFIGGTFNPDCGEYGGFAMPKPADYFVWDATTCSWIPPISYPTDGLVYIWNFQKRQWSLVPVQAPETIFIG
jgi:hypothetical protein